MLANLHIFFRIS